MPSTLLAMSASRRNLWTGRLSIEKWGELAPNMESYGRAREAACSGLSGEGDPAARC